jgi:hypothetical protein
LASFKFELEIDQKLLSEYFKQQLNPLCIEINEITNLFINTQESYRYERLYVEYWFYNPSVLIKTHKVNHELNPKFKHKHVFLVGLEDQKMLKEY